MSWLNSGFIQVNFTKQVVTYLYSIAVNTFVMLGHINTDTAVVDTLAGKYLKFGNTKKRNIPGNHLVTCAFFFVANW